MITIINYGLGNLRSIQKAFEKFNISVNISADYNEILNSEKLILPGVGNFEQGIKNLQETGLYDTLNEAVINNGIPILGICLGMQLMTEFSEEGNIDGFGWIKGKTLKFSFEGNKLKIPHMGWNNLSFKKNDSIYKDIDQNDLFYFVHSYYVSCDEENDILSETVYGKKFTSAFSKHNIYGCQYHPEKSFEPGIKLLSNFINNCHKF